VKTLADSVGFQILLALSIQLIGFGCAGFLRRFLVYPPAMLWPVNLAQIALNRALRDNCLTETANGWQISRYRFFLYCSIGMFVYFWLPNYIFEALSFFNWPTWISPMNVKLAIICGSLGGMGLNPWPTFDWNILSYFMDPVVTPWFSLVNRAFGAFVIGFFLIVPIYFTNTWGSAHFPINSNKVFDGNGNVYNVSRVLGPDFTLNIREYEAYGPPYMTAALLIVYSAQFAIHLAVLVYAALHHRSNIVNGIRGVFKQKSPRPAYEDIHSRLMRAYKEVPDWWYFMILAISFAMGCTACQVYDTGVPIWGIIVALGISLVLQLPFGILKAVTNTEFSDNVIAEFIAGYLVPNRPIANMIFKTFSSATCSHSLQFAADLKLGQYMKIPPRTTFTAQIVATIIASFVTIGVNAWQMAHIPDVCSPHQPSRFTCPGTHRCAEIRCKHHLNAYN
jgi:OPT family small oligopeptide transporter